MFDIIIVGGGLVGAACALDLASSCPYLKIGILEQTEMPIVSTKNSNTYTNANTNPTTNNIITSFDARIYAIAPHNIAYLEQLGIMGLDNSNQVATINKMLVYGDSNSKIEFDRQLGQQLFLAKIIPGNYLQQCIYAKLISLDNVIFIHDGLNDVKIHDGHVELFGHSKSYLTKLVVAADGAHSFIRGRVGLDANNMQKIDYHQMGIVANFACEIPHNNTAYQWFSDDGVLAYLPLPNNHISIVWACENSAYKLQLPEDVFTDLVIKAGHSKLGNLKLISKVMAFPLSMRLMEKVYTSRIALIGDAAHTVHPLAGQGLNLGLADARILVEILSKVEKYQIGDIGLLAKYNNLRLPEVKKMQLTCHALQRLYSANSGILRHLRNAGLNLVNSLPIVKKQLIKQSCML